MLATTGDVARLVDLVTDPDRHDRMLELTGADAAALAEITTCQNLANSLTAGQVSRVRALAAVLRATPFSRPAPAPVSPARTRQFADQAEASAPAYTRPAERSRMAEYWPQVVLRCADALSGNERPPGETPVP